MNKEKEFHYLEDGYYVEKLEQEIERLKEELKKNKNPLRGIFAQVTDDDLLRNNGAMYSELEDYKSRCEKAIEFNQIILDSDYVYSQDEIAQKNLNILQGGDE